MIMNKVMLIGRLVKDVVIETKDKNIRVYGTIAINNGKDKQADFIPFVAFGKTGELIADYCGKKGDPICVEGKVSITSKNVGSERKPVYETYANVIVNNVIFLPITKDK